MANTVYDEETYLEKLRLLSLDLKALAVCRVRSEHLDALGVPDGSVVFSRPRKRYRARSGEETVYQYTNEYLYIGHRKYYISKTYPYPEKPAYGTDVNDPKKPENRRILRERLELRMEIRSELKQHGKLARMRLESLNAMKSKKLARLRYETAAEEAYQELLASDEYTQILAELDKLLGTEYGRIADTKREEQRSSFRNEIYNERGERLRSKNELIAAWCAHDCGLSYTLEPFYPESELRADLCLLCGGKEVYVEICGMRTKAKYEERLQEKQALAQKHGLPLVVIDMTAYPDGRGEPQTRLRFDRLRRILQRIRLGLLTGGIVTPY